MSIPEERTETTDQAHVDFHPPLGIVKPCRNRNEKLAELMKEQEAAKQELNDLKGKANVELLRTRLIQEIKQRGDAISELAKSLKHDLENQN